MKEPCLIVDASRAENDAAEGPGYAHVDDAGVVLRVETGVMGSQGVLSEGGARLAGGCGRAGCSWT